MTQHTPGYRWFTRKVYESLGLSYFLPITMPLFEHLTKSAITTTDMSLINTQLSAIAAAHKNKIGKQKDPPTVIVIAAEQIKNAVIVWATIYIETATKRRETHCRFQTHSSATYRYQQNPRTRTQIHLEKDRIAVADGGSKQQRVAGEQNAPDLHGGGGILFKLPLILPDLSSPFISA